MAMNELFITVNSNSCLHNTVSYIIYIPGTSSDRCWLVKRGHLEMHYWPGKIAELVAAPLPPLQKQVITMPCCAMRTGFTLPNSTFARLFHWVSAELQRNSLWRNNGTEHWEHNSTRLNDFAKLLIRKMLLNEFVLFWSLFRYIKHIFTALFKAWLQIMSPR